LGTRLGIGDLACDQAGIDDRRISGISAISSRAAIRQGHWQVIAVIGKVFRGTSLLLAAGHRPGLVLAVACAGPWLALSSRAGTLSRPCLDIT
jgi:hypothetical protein